MPDRRLLLWQIRTFALLWSGYAAYYLCRVNFAVAQPAIQQEFGWSSAQVGSIPSTYAAIYAVGQFINGQLGERFGARRMMTMAMTVACVTNLLFSYTSSYAVMLFLWGLNGFAQSAGWSLVVKTISNWTTSRRRGLVIGLISTCYQVGNVLSWLLAGFMIDIAGWRAAFYVPSAIMIPIGFALALWLRDDPKEAGFEPVRDDIVPKAQPKEVNGVTSAWEVLRETLSNKTLWILAIAFFTMNGVRYAFMNWAVQYMADFHNQPIKDSAFRAVMLPLIGSVGAVTAGWASDHLFGKRRAPVCAIMLTGLALTCIAFAFLPQGATTWATLLLGVAGFMIYGPDMLASGAATVDVHPSAAAAATGLTMATGAAGAIFSGAGIGWLKDYSGGDWQTVFLTLALFTVVSTALMASIWNARPKGS